MRDHMRDHGGDLDLAAVRYGAGDWLDLSTGINRRPWPMPMPGAESWRALPTRAAQMALVQQAAQVWGAPASAAGIALAGAQAAIQGVPALRAEGGRAVGGRAVVLGPTYNEHAACLAAAGWQVSEATRPEALRGADLAVIVNPNNPDGRCHARADVTALADQVGLLIVDESFCDMTPHLSVMPDVGRAGLLVLRSFGKFYGLAGLRLGFAFGTDADIARLAQASGPWPVSGPAIEIGRAALADAAWASAMRQQLTADAARADALACAAGWQVVGGTTLFRLYDTGDAVAARDLLARHKIWSRIFPWSDRLLRLGLPGPEPEWDRLTGALRGGIA